MRNLVSLFLVVNASVLFAQSSFKALQEFDNQSLEFKMDRFTTRELLPLQINLPKQSLIEQKVTPADFKIITPQQFSLTNYPLRDLSKMDDLLLGTSLSNTLEMGRQKIQTTYVFDVHGNFVGHETSFSFGKNK